MARENQGVQIALIATVILTLILFGTTFYFYKQYSEAVAKEEGGHAEGVGCEQEDRRTGEVRVDAEENGRIRRGRPGT